MRREERAGQWVLGLKVEEAAWTSMPQRRWHCRQDGWTDVLSFGDTLNWNGPFCCYGQLWPAQVAVLLGLRFLSHLVTGLKAPISLSEQ